MNKYIAQYVVSKYQKIIVKLVLNNIHLYIYIYTACHFSGQFVMYQNYKNVPFDH
jgi:hypothetical protein